MNRRQKKKKGLLLVDKRNESKEKKVVKEEKEVKEEDKQYFLNKFGRVSQSPNAQFCYPPIALLYSLYYLPTQLFVLQLGVLMVMVVCRQFQLVYSTDEVHAYACSKPVFSVIPYPVQQSHYVSFQGYFRRFWGVVYQVLFQPLQSEREHLISKL